MTPNVFLPFCPEFDEADFSGVAAATTTGVGAGAGAGVTAATTGAGL